MVARKSDTSRLAGAVNDIAMKKKEIYKATQSNQKSRVFPNHKKHCIIIYSGKGKGGLPTMPGDLHTHTTYSDGSTPVAKLPFLARCAGMTHLAISDHDSIQSVRYAYAHPVQDGVRLIPAAELTGYDFERSHRVHILTFWPDLDCPALRRHCDIMRQRRNECALQS